MKKQKKIRCWFHKMFLWCFICVPCFAQNARLEELRGQLDLHPAKDTVRTNIIMEMARIYNRVNKDSMYRYCVVLLDEARLTSDPVQLANASTMMGIYWLNTQPEESLNYLQQAYDTYKSTNMQRAMINVNNLLAISFYYMHDYEKQLLYLKKALQDVLEINDKNLEITTLHNIAGTYFYLKNYKLAEEYSDMALREAQEHNPQELDKIMISQAGIEFQKGNYKRAVELNEEVIANVRKKGQKRMELICLANIAECRIKSGQYEEARRILEKCGKEADFENDLDYSQMLQLSVTLDSLTGNFKQAFYNQREIEQLTAKQHSADQLRNSSERTMQSEVKYLEIQHSRLEPVYEKQKAQLSKMNILIFMLIAATGGGIALTAYSGFFVKKLNKETDQLRVAQKSLLEKKERLTCTYRGLYQKKEQLQEEHERLVRSDRSKTELFKNISHDLQIPLVRLQQTLTKLMASDINEAQFRQATGGLTNSVGNMSLLLENLLQWSKFQSRDIQTKPQYVEMTTLINDAFVQQKYSASEKNITLSNALEHRLYVYADEDSIKILLKITLQNIVKLSGTNAGVAVSGAKSGNEGRIRIHYHGVMPLKDLFLKLSETDGYGTEQSELGKAVSLGWMLCRALAIANNGSIEVEDVDSDNFNILLHLPLEELRSKTTS